MVDEKFQQATITVTLPGELIERLVARLDGGSVSAYVLRLVQADLETMVKPRASAPTLPRMPHGAQPSLDQPSA